MGIMAAKVKKATGAGRGRPPADGKKKKKSKGVNFNTYIFRTLKQVHPKIGLSKKSMSIMNSLVMDAFEKIAVEAGSPEDWPFEEVDEHHEFPRHGRVRKDCR